MARDKSHCVYIQYTLLRLRVCECVRHLSSQAQETPRGGGGGARAGGVATTSGLISWIGGRNESSSSSSSSSKDDTEDVSEYRKKIRDLEQSVNDKNYQISKITRKSKELETEKENVKTEYELKLQRQEKQLQDARDTIQMLETYVWWLCLYRTVVCFFV